MLKSTLQPYKLLTFFLCTFPFNSGVLPWTQKRGHEGTACIVNTARAPPSFASAATHRHGHAHRSSHFQSKPVCVAFDLFSAIAPRLCQKRKKIYIYLHELRVRILVSSVIGRQKKYKESSLWPRSWREMEVAYEWHCQLAFPTLSVGRRAKSWLAVRAVGQEGDLRGSLCAYWEMRGVNNLPR